VTSTRNSTSTRDSTSTRTKNVVESGMCYLHFVTSLKCWQVLTRTCDKYSFVTSASAKSVVECGMQTVLCAGVCVRRLFDVPRVTRCRDQHTTPLFAIQWRISYYQNILLTAVVTGQHCCRTRTLLRVLSVHHWMLYGYNYVHRPQHNYAREKNDFKWYYSVSEPLPKRCALC